MPRPRPFAILGVALPWVWFLVRDASPWLDLVAIFLPLLAVAGVAVCLLATAVRRRVGAAIAAGSWAAFGLAATFGPIVPEPSGTPVEPLRVAVANTGDADDLAAAARAVVAQNADVVIAPESSVPVDRALRAEYPHVAGATFGIGVYSRVPFVEPPAPVAFLTAERGVRFAVLVDGVPVVIYGVHLLRPGLEAADGIQTTAPGQRRTVERLVRAIAEEDAPVIVAGDLNLSDRSSGYRKLTARLDDAMRSRLAGPTSMKPWLRPLFLRIDHILYPEAWCAGRADRYGLTAGAAHRGVVAEVGPCR